MPAWLLNWRVLGAVALAGALLAAYVQTVRLSGCQAELRGERERVRVLGAQIEAQNAAVAALELERGRRTAQAAQEAAMARQRAEGLHMQVRHLQDVLEAAERRPEAAQASACPAGDAAQEVRRALAGG